ncbi:MAG: hypothetical protein ACREBS_08920 [Nitrososphaerales archaeon]
MKKSNMNIVLTAAVLSLVVVGLALGVAYIPKSNQQSSISSSATSVSSTGILPPYYANDVSYSTTTIQVPPGVQVNQAFTGYVEFLHFPNDIEKYAVFLVEAKVLGFVNSSLQTGIGFPTVISTYVLQVNQTLMGNIPSGQKILVQQEAGVTRLSNGTYVNGTLDSYSPISIGKTYVFPLSMPNNSTLSLMGPEGIFPVVNGLVYLPNDKTSVTLTQFEQIWNGSYTASTSSSVANISSSSSCILTPTVETITGNVHTNNSTINTTTWTTTASECQ